MATPSSADTLRKNPLGLYVDAIDWSRELEPTAAPASTASLTLASSSAPANIPAEASLDPSPAGPTTSPEIQP